MRRSASGARRAGCRLHWAMPLQGDRPRPPRSPSSPAPSRPVSATPSQVRRPCALDRGLGGHPCSSAFRRWRPSAPVAAQLEDARPAGRSRRWRCDRAPRSARGTLALARGGADRGNASGTKPSPLRACHSRERVLCEKWRCSRSRLPAASTRPPMPRRIHVDVQQTGVLVSAFMARWPYRLCASRCGLPSTSPGSIVLLAICATRASSDMALAAMLS